jgi:hypothetical protein
MVDIPGGEGANKGFWREQLRDRFGRFVEMFGDVIIDINLPGVQGKVRARGKFIGNSEPRVARIEILDNSEISKGIYLVEHSDITSAPKGVAKLSKKFLDEKNIDSGIVDGAVDDSLKSAISGDDILKTRLKTVVRILKGEGRFPVPRLGLLQELGKDTDTVKGAKVDYKKVFDAEPGLQERFKDFDSMWQYVYDNSAGTTTQSPNDLDDIDPEVKMLNRAYAEHILGLEPDGMITVYRNAVNGKDTESESAVGYVSLDRNLAYDYASHRDNVAKNGRYEIDVKPDEFQGMLGYSQAEDEYALTIGRGVTEQEGRVRRVGDLAMVDLEASWLKDWGRETFNRGSGGTPYRHFSVAGAFDFHEVEPLGETLTDFLDKYGLEASAIKSKFEQLHGEGSYGDYKNSGNTLSFANIKNLFVELDDGKVGLDAAKIFSSETVGENATYKNDRFDNTMKMLSTLQELSGEPFMTHKSRDYKPKETKTGIFNEYDPGQRTSDSSSNAAEDTPLTDLGFDPEEEITIYRGVPTDADSIVSGDWVTTLPQLAKDYSGGGKVISIKVKAKDLLTDPSSGEGAYTEEMLYRPK